MQVELLFPIVATLFLTAGQLYLAPVGLAFVSRCGPASARSTAIGIWFLAGGIAGLIAGRVGTLYSSWSAPSFFFLFVPQTRPKIGPLKAEQDVQAVSAQRKRQY